MMKKKKLKKYQKILTIIKSTTVLIVPNVISGYRPEKMLSKGRNRNSVLLVSKHLKKIEILNLIIKNVLKIIMSKIRRQQSQKLIKLQKILVASLLFFKARENKTCLLLCSIWRAKFFLLSKNVKSFHCNRLSRI